MLYDAYNVSKFEYDAPLDYRVSGGNFGAHFRLENAEGGSLVNVGDVVNVWMGSSQLWQGIRFFGWAQNALVLSGGGMTMIFSNDSALPDGAVVSLTQSPYDLANPPPCYLEGTLVETAEGLIAVEELTEGALLKTLSGDFAPLKWLGRRSVSERMVAQAAAKSLPVRFAAGALGHGLPERDLWLSPDHCLHHDGVLVQAKELVNGTTVAQMHPGRPITYFHLLLDRHDVIFAEGAAAETYRPCSNIFGFNNAETFPEGVNTHQPRKTGCFPVKKKGPAVEAFRAQIAEAAAELPQDALRAA